MQSGMCQSQLEIIMQLPLNTGLSNSLDYKILDATDNVCTDLQHNIQGVWSQWGALCSFCNICDLEPDSGARCEPICGQFSYFLDTTTEMCLKMCVLDFKRFKIQFLILIFFAIISTGAVKLRPKWTTHWLRFHICYILDRARPIGVSFGVIPIN